VSVVVRACLLDEDLDPGLADLLDAAGLGWRVTTVRAEGWLGVENGPLLDAMAGSRLRVLVTGDRIEELARAIDRVRDGELIEVGAGDPAARP
jgi:hypothetical protein